MGLTLDLGKHLGEMEQFCLSRPHPGGEVAHLAIVAIVGEPHFGSLDIMLMLVVVE